MGRRRIRVRAHAHADGLEAELVVESHANTRIRARPLRTGLAGALILANALILTNAFLEPVATDFPGLMS